MGYVPRELFNAPLGNLVMLTLNYAAQLVHAAHIAIAVNRFFTLTEVGNMPVLASKQLYLQTWSSLKQRITVIAVLLYPTPTAALRFVGKISLVETTVSGAFSVLWSVSWVSKASLI